MPADANSTTCPICKKRFDAASSPSMPFCSSRCRTIDLGQWLTESYRIPGPPLSDDEEEEVEKAPS